MSQLRLYEHPLLNFSARAKGEGVEVIIKFKDENVPVHTYYFDLHPRDLDAFAFRTRGEVQQRMFVEAQLRQDALEAGINRFWHGRDCIASSDRAGPTCFVHSDATHEKVLVPLSKRLKIPVAENGKVVYIFPTSPRHTACAFKVQKILETECPCW